MQGDRRRVRRQSEEQQPGLTGGLASRLTPRNIASALVEGALTLSLAGVVILIGGLVVWLTVPELRTPGLVLIGVALVMLAIPIVTHLRTVRDALTARSGRYAANTIVMVVAFMLILIMVGFISFSNSARIDMTATRQFTLAPQTVKVLEELNQKVNARVYTTPDDVRQVSIKRQAEDYLYEFNRRNRDFNYEFIDPDLTPARAPAGRHPRVPHHRIPGRGVGPQPVPGDPVLLWRGVRAFGAGPGERSPDLHRRAAEGGVLHDGPRRAQHRRLG